MRISVLCSSTDHPIYPALQQWCDEQPHETELLNAKSELSGGDMLFLVSCSELISEKERNGYNHTLVLHASDLPKGRGWSPYIWDLLDGAETLTVSLLEASEPVDSGPIWAKDTFKVGPDWLWDEINEALFAAELKLMSFAVNNMNSVAPVTQDNNKEITYCPKRTPEDSELDIDKSIREQFDLLRVCDPSRYPATFRIHGHKYKLIVEKADD
jgi:methionyl-tRNA formyltransferase